MAEIKPEIETFAKIKVIGVGGGGNSAVNRMIEARIKGVEFIAMNTDLQALHYSLAPEKLHLGKTITRGLGAGMDPEIGRKAAEESQNDIRDLVTGSDMLFLTCGLGGGTGSGGIPVIASMAKELGILTVAIVTKPFSFEGGPRSKVADEALAKLKENVDTIITIPNDKLLNIIDQRTSIVDAFKIVDEILRQGVQGLSELITVPGLINVDFADVKAIMQNTGSALMGMGHATGENRAADAARSAISSPLLEMSINGAKGILFTISGSPNLTMFEVSEAARIITENADPGAKIIFGAVINDELKDEIKITVIATGFDSKNIIPNISKQEAPQQQAPQRNYSPINLNTFKNNQNFNQNSMPRPASSQPQYNQQVQNQPVANNNLAENNFDARRIDNSNVMDMRKFKKEYSNSNQNLLDDLEVEETNEVKEDDDLEIPAFIRRKMM